MLEILVLVSPETHTSNISERLLNAFMLAMITWNQRNELLTLSLHQAPLPPVSLLLFQMTKCVSRSTRPINTIHFEPRRSPSGSRARARRTNKARTVGGSPEAAAARYGPSGRLR